MIPREARVINVEEYILPHRGMPKKPANGYEYVPGDKFRFRLKEHPEYYIIKTWLGLGDCIYQKILIEELYTMYRENLIIKTPWPELYNEMCVKYMEPEQKLRKQTENIKLNTNRFLKLINRTNLKLHYNVDDFRRMSMLEAYEKNHFKIKNFRFRINVKEEWKQKVEELNLPENTILLYPPTIRAEWNCPERNPDPKYFQTIIDKFKNDFYFVTLGAIEKNKEQYVKELKNVNKNLDHGELHYTTIFALMQKFPSVIRPSFMLPAAIALEAKSLCLYGGHLPKEVLTDSRMNLKNLKQIQPCPFTFTFHDLPYINRKLDLEEVFEKFRSLTNE